MDVFDVNVCQRRLQAHLRPLAAANDIFEDAMGWHSMTEEDLKLAGNQTGGYNLESTASHADGGTVVAKKAAQNSRR